MRILPYRTVENVIDGVVITFVGTSLFGRVLKAAAEEAERQEVSIINTVRGPLLLLDRDLRIESANESFYRTSRSSRKRPRVSCSTIWSTASGTSLPSEAFWRRFSVRRPALRNTEWNMSSRLSGTGQCCGPLGSCRRMLENLKRCCRPSRTLLVGKKLERSPRWANRDLRDLVNEPGVIP
jgi:hypothetical protein